MQMYGNLWVQRPDALSCHDTSFGMRIMPPTYKMGKMKSYSTYSQTSKRIKNNMIIEVKYGNNTDLLSYFLNYSTFMLYDDKISFFVQQ